MQGSTILDCIHASKRKWMPTRVRLLPSEHIIHRCVGWRWQRRRLSQSLHRGAAAADNETSELFSLALLNKVELQLVQQSVSASCVFRMQAVGRFGSLRRLSLLPCV